MRHTLRYVLVDSAIRLEKLIRSLDGRVVGRNGVCQSLQALFHAFKGGLKLRQHVGNSLNE